MPFLLLTEHFGNFIDLSSEVIVFNQVDSYAWDSRRRSFCVQIHDFAQGQSAAKSKKITFQGTQYANCTLNYDERRRSLRAISLLTEAELQVESDLSVRLVSEKVFVS